MANIIVFVLLRLVVLVLLASFVMSIVMFCTANNKNKKDPGTYSEEQMNIRRNFLIATSVIVGIIVFVAVGFYLLLMSAVAYM